MNIGIIGLGVLGTAYKSGFLKYHNVLTYDIKGKYYFENNLNSKIVFIYVPSPSKKNGECDTSIVS